MVQQKIVSSEKVNKEERFIKNEPQLRFKEFSEPFKEVLLGDISSNGMYGMNCASKEFDGENKYIRITDIDENSHNFVPNPLSSPDGVLEDKFLLKENDIVFARTGASTGKSYLYDKNDGKLYFAGFLIKLEITKAYAPFVYYNTLRENYNNWVSIMSVRSGQPGINLEEYKKFKINLPSLEEQEKIANFLEAIDKKIELLEKKYYYYHELKTYFMQRIFTQELSFFDNEIKWNWLKFEDIFKTVSTKKYQIKSAEINKSGLYEVINQGQQSIAGYHNDNSKLFNDLPIIIYGDHTTFIKYRTEPFIVGADGVKLLTLKIDVDMKYMYYALDYFNIKPEGYKRHFSIIKKVDLPIPSISEQKNISNFLSIFDKKINFIEIQRKNMDEFKKGLLQKMFV